MANNAAVVEELQKELSPVGDRAMDMFIGSNDDYVSAGQLLKEVKSKSKIVKERKEQITKPLYAAYKSAGELFKPVETQLFDIEKLIKTKMLSYKQEQDEIARKEQERVQRRLDKGTMRPDTAAKKLEEVSLPSNAEAGVVQSKVKKVRIIDWSKIPKEYYLRDSVREAIYKEVKKDALGNKAQGIEPIEVPGSEVYEADSLSA